MNVPLHYTVTGPEDAPPLLFLHGFMGSAEDWEPVVRDLRDEFRCIRFDLPGHGRSAAARGNMAQACETIVRQLAATWTRRFGVIGYSMGGRIALYLALHYRDRVGGLLLESASPGLLDASERFKRAAADAELAKRLEAIGHAGGNGFEAFLKDWYAQPLWATLRRRPELLESTMARRRRNDPAALAQTLRTLGVGEQPSLWDELPRCPAPVRCVVGSEDVKYRALAGEMRAWAPHISVVQVSGCGHNVHLEAPGEYVRCVRDFFSKQK